MKSISNYRHKLQRLQNGGVAIEFAILFPFIFVLFYAGLAYSLYLMMLSSLDDFLIQALRDSVSVYTSPLTVSDTQLHDAMLQVMTLHEERTWLVQLNLSGCLPSGDWYQVDRMEQTIATCARIDFPLPDIHLFGMSIPGMGHEVRVARVVNL